MVHELRVADAMSKERTSEYWLGIERKLPGDDKWKEHMRLPPNTSIEYAEILMGRLEKPLPGTRYRLVGTRIEMTREVLA